MRFDVLVSVAVFFKPRVMLRGRPSLQLEHVGHQIYSPPRAFVR